MGRRWGGFLCVLASMAWGQPASAPAPEATFSTTTKLVQVSVVAQDKRGNPVPDLRQDEFQILDNGVPQAIRLFIAEKPAPPPAALAKTSGAFTNQIGLPGGSHSGYSVILFDNLVTGFGKPEEDGTSYGVQRVLQTLRSLPGGEKIALYAVGRKLQVVREFTTDRESLERQLRSWKPSPDDAETGQALCPSGDFVSPIVARQAPEVAIGLARAGVQCIRGDTLNRVESFDQELEQIADHLAGVPGRKNLIWMANRFPITGGPAIQRLMDAGVAIYPVDEAGVCRTCPPPPNSAMEALARQTGGVVFSGRNDLDVAVRQAIEDGRVSYTLGFYQPGDDKRPRVHRLTGGKGDVAIG